MFLRNGEKYYICWVDNLLFFFLTVKEFTESITVECSYCDKFDTSGLEGLDHFVTAIDYAVFFSFKNSIQALW